MNNRQGKNVLTTVIAVLLAFASVLYTSCKKDETTQSTDDKCTGIVCQNGGSCINGFCYCVAGYEGEKCERASVSRYLGDWDVQETVFGSTKASNIGKVSLYVMKISKGAKALDIVLDNFMGKGYTGIKGLIARKYAGATTESDVPTKFIFVQDQTIAGTYITITSGNGKVNETGTEFSCTYYLQYLDAGVVVQDSISILASIKL